MVWVSSALDRASTIAVLPEIAGAFAELYRALWTQPHIPPETLELCRLRLAQLHRCDVELQRHECALTCDKREQLANWNTDSRFADAERACLAFTEVYAMDTQAITDELAEAVKLHFGDSGLVFLVEALGILDGMTRLSLLWQLPALPGAQTGRGQ
jgi:alkylhydroperoxidase family enzyme